MKFNLSYNLDSGSVKFLEMFIGIESDLSLFFKDKEYGVDIQFMIIGITCKRVQLGYEKFSQAPKPIWVDHKIIKYSITGAPLEIYKSYTNQIDFSKEGEYEGFISSSEAVAMKILAKKIIDSLSNLDKLTKKCKDFDKEQFKKDIITFFVEKGLYEENENNLANLSYSF